MDNLISEFNGERVIEGCTPERILFDHLGRYEFAERYVVGKDVLDISCGTGYGTHRLIKAGAKKIVGIDISPETVLYAQKRYFNDSVIFQTGSILSLDFADNSFDVVVSFETIEHVDLPEKALSELRRVLRPGGVLVISSPNRLLTSPGKSLSDKPNNPFHFFEWNLNEFVESANKLFYVEKIYGQRGVCRMLLMPVFNRIFRLIAPWVLGPERGTASLEEANKFKEYRYITLVCKKNN